MGEQVIHIEIYLKKKENSSAYIGYEVEDNDSVILFSPFILYDCIQEFEKNEEILFISSFELTERFKIMQTKVYEISSHVQYKINCLINFIKKNEKLKQYIGIKTIY